MSHATDFRRYTVQILNASTLITMIDNGISEEFEDQFSLTFKAYCDYINSWAHEKGFHDDEREMGTAIALMHSELSEALESHREGVPESAKIEGYSELEEELADTIIRIMDTAGEHDLDVGGAIVAKMRVNEDRPQKHGKEY